MIMSDPQLSQDSSPAGLAALLAAAYSDIEKLHLDLSSLRKRTEKAERLAASLQSLRQDQNSSPNTTSHSEDPAAIIFAYEERATRAEQARDDAEAKKALVLDAWNQLSHFFSQLDTATAEARISFSRTLQDGATFVVPHILSNQRGRSFIPAYPALPLLANTATSRRPRTPSIDAYGQPPNKRSRQDYPDHSSRQHPQQQQQQQQLPPRMIIPPGDQQKSSSSNPRRRGHSHHTHHRPTSRSHSRQSRSSSRSSSASLSVDEMLLQATTDGSQSLPNGNSADTQHRLSPQQHIPVPHHHSRRRSRRDENKTPMASPPHPSQAYPTIQQSIPQHFDHEHHPPQQQQQQQQQQQVRRSYTSDFHGVSSVHDYHQPSKQSSTVILAANAGPGNEPLPQPGQFQTHIFAPPVTGAPVKKQKFAPGASASMPTVAPATATTSTEGNPATPTPATTVFPAMNEQGQRICRQCGMPGRYKDGKCVEKWGPGPMGPGTVCDRCRKKMKRVERRGTLETQQQQQQLQAQIQAQAQNIPNASSLPQIQPSSSSSQRTSPSQAQHHVPIHRTDTLPAHPQQQHQQQGHGHSHLNVSSTRGEEGFNNTNTSSSSAHLTSHPSNTSAAAAAHSTIPTHSHRSSTSSSRVPPATARSNRNSPSRVPAAVSGGGTNPTPTSSLREMEDDIPTSSVPRGGAGGGGGAGSRSSSRNAMRASVGAGAGAGAGASSGGRGTPVGTTESKKSSPLGRVSTVSASGGSAGGTATTANANVATTKRSSSSKSPGEASAMDVDAEGEADAEEEDEEDADAEIEAEIEGLVGVGASAGASTGAEDGAPRNGNANANANAHRPRAKSREKAAMEVDHGEEGEHDAEQELLEAVDAAEANSISSGGGRSKEDD